MTLKKKPTIDAPEYWDEQALLAEELRQFDVCHGCRLCFNFCPAFPDLFTLTDRKEEGQIKAITRRELRLVEDSCYQCKLCFVKCPYTPPHELALDIPRLLVRARLVNKKRDGVTWQDRILANTDLTGKLGSATAPMANLGNRAAPIRFVLEKTVGVHRKANLPRFHSRTFAAWFRANENSLNGDLPPTAKKAALFYTCTVNHNDPAVGIAAARVLSHNGIRVTVPPQQCCGMPFLDTGALDLALGKVKANVQSLAALVRQDFDIVVISPSCSLMMKKEYPELAATEEARLVADHTFDVSEYLWKIKAAGSLKTDFSAGFGAKVKSVAYHAACHTRAQFMGNKGANLIELIPGVVVEQIERCSHHDGTWGLKKASHDISLKYGERLFEAMKEAEAGLFVSDCPLAANQIEQGTGTRPVHPMQVLAQAYGI